MKLPEFTITTAQNLNWGARYKKPRKEEKQDGDIGAEDEDTGVKDEDTGSGSAALAEVAGLEFR